MTVQGWGSESLVMARKGQVAAVSADDMPTKAAFIATLFGTTA